MPSATFLLFYTSDDHFIYREFVTVFCSLWPSFVHYFLGILFSLNEVLVLLLLAFFISPFSGWTFSASVYVSMGGGCSFGCIYYPFGWIFDWDPTAKNGSRRILFAVWRHCSSTAPSDLMHCISFHLFFLPLYGLVGRTNNNSFQSSDDSSFPFQLPSHLWCSLNLRNTSKWTAMMLGYRMKLWQKTIRRRFVLLNGDNRRILRVLWATERFGGSKWEEGLCFTKIDAGDFTKSEVCYSWIEEERT